MPLQPIRPPVVDSFTTSQDKNTSQRHEYEGTYLILKAELSLVSVFCRIKSLIVDFICLLAGFISLFGRLGNSLRMLRDSNGLPARFGSPDSLEPRFSQYLPVTGKIRSLSSSKERA
jgi:hypothetical protein